MVHPTKPSCDCLAHLARQRRAEQTLQIFHLNATQPHIVGSPNIPEDHHQAPLRTDTPPPTARHDQRALIVQKCRQPPSSSAALGDLQRSEYTFLGHATHAPSVLGSNPHSCPCGQILQRARCAPALRKLPLLRSPSGACKGGLWQCAYPELDHTHGLLWHISGTVSDPQAQVPL